MRGSGRTGTCGLTADCSPRSSVSNSLDQQELADNYSILRQLGSGTYGRVVLARCHRTGIEVALKVLPKSSTKLKDFLREFNLSYYLSPHSAIINTYDVAFETPTSYVFAQEQAPLGDLFEAITPQSGLSETAAKAALTQVASALEFMHSKGLVHRDVKPENILVFDAACERVKLMDFGMTKKTGTMVRKVSKGIPYTPPEVCSALKGEQYAVDTAADVWGFAVLIFCALTGNFPWELAHLSDTFYGEFAGWQRRKALRTPSQWKMFTSRLMRLFRRMLEPRPERRCSIQELCKYTDDVWLLPRKDSSSEGSPPRRVDPHDDLDTLLRKHGIETEVSPRWRERRISEWILAM